MHVKSLFEHKGCNADWLYIKTFMDLSAGVHDVKCTRKINIDKGVLCISHHVHQLESPLYNVNRE